MRKLLTLAVSGALFLAMTALPALADHEGATYTGTLSELNSSGGSGDVYIEVSEDGESITVELAASGLNLDGPHAMHIHGIVDGETVTASSCPTMDADANGDGVVDVVEGVPFYGGVQVSLTTEGDTSPDSGLAVERYPAGTSIDYSRATIDLPDPLKPNIDKLHVVVHGVDENGNGTLDLDQTERSTLSDDLPREGTLPALCGVLTAQAAGPVQTGGGGTAGMNAAPLLISGLALLGFAAVGSRRATDLDRS